MLDSTDSSWVVGCTTGCWVVDCSVVRVCGARWVVGASVNDCVVRAGSIGCVLRS